MPLLFQRQVFSHQGSYYEGPQFEFAIDVEFLSQKSKLASISKNQSSNIRGFTVILKSVLSIFSFAKSQ